MWQWVRKAENTLGVRSPPTTWFPGIICRPSALYAEPSVLTYFIQVFVLSWNSLEVGVFLVWIYQEPLFWGCGISSNSWSLEVTSVRSVMEEGNVVLVFQVISFFVWGLFYVTEKWDQAGAHRDLDTALTPRPSPPQLRDKWLGQTWQDTAHWISYQMLNEFKRLQLWKQMLSLRMELWLGRRRSLGTKGVQVSKGERSHKPAWRKLSNSRLRWAWHYILLPIRS